MAGPAQQQTRRLVVPPGEAQRYYSAASLAFKVQNFTATPEGTITSVLGPTAYEPLRDYSAHIGSDYVTAIYASDTPHGIFQTNLQGGLVDMLVIRAGSKIYRHAGWYRGWEILLTGLSSENRPRFPDQFTVLNDLVIWTNGIDRPQAIASDGSIANLGFAEIPAPPDTAGPMSHLHDTANFPNYYGYSWPGRIGTVGDVLNGQSGSLLSGAWYYYLRYEDSYGNLSAPSPASRPVVLDTLSASPNNGTGRGWGSLLGEEDFYDAELADLTRQFAVMLPEGPDECVAMHVYRTPDTKHVSTIPRFLTRVPNKRAMTYPDNMADSDLGSEMDSGVVVPVFRVMCTHQGRLVIANTLEDPGIVRRSDPGFPGTFSSTEFVYPDSGGAEVTGVASHDGALLAFTENSVYSLQDFSVPVPLAQGVGCVAPSSIRAMANGALIWLARDGFYAMTGGAISKVSTPIDRTVRNYLNRGRLGMSAAAYDSASGEYRCAVPPAGEQHNTLILCFDGAHWRRQRLDLHIADFTATNDWRQYLLGLGHKKISDSSSKLWDSTRVETYVMDRSTKHGVTTAEDIIYRSAWLRGDELGLLPINVRSMFVGMIDAWNDDVTIKFYRNGSWAEHVSMTDLKSIGVNDDSGVVTDVAGAAVLGTSKVHDPRLFWRQIPAGLENVNSWAFEISAARPTRVHLASFAFDISAATSGSVKGRIPLRSDT